MFLLGSHDFHGHGSWLVCGVALLRLKGSVKKEINSLFFLLESLQ